MTIRTTLLAGAALLLCASAAGAAPATAQSAVNMRAGPGTQYPVVATIPGGAPVDVRGCTGSWCAVNYAGESGFASRSYLAMAGGPSVGVAVAPAYPYGYPGYAYGDDYYDDGYAYGPSFGFYANGRFHRRHDHGWNRHGWNGQTGWNRGGNIGQQPQTNVPGTANYNRGFNRGSGFAGRTQMSAPAGMRGPAPGSVAPMGGGGGGAPLAGTASGAAAGIGGGAGAAAGGATGAIPGTAGVRH